MNKIVNFIKSESIVFISLLLLITGSVVHTGYLFYLSFTAELAVFIKVLISVFYAVAIETAILVFIVHASKSSKLIPYFYLLANILTNGLYYYGNKDKGLNIMLASILFSLVISFSLYFFSHLFRNRLEEKQEDTSLAEENSALKEQLSDTERVNDKLNLALIAKEEEIKRYEREVASFQTSIEELQGDKSEELSKLLEDYQSLVTELDNAKEQGLLITPEQLTEFQEAVDKVNKYKDRAAKAAITRKSNDDSGGEG